MLKTDWKLFQPVVVLRDNESNVPGRYKQEGKSVYFETYIAGGESERKAMQPKNTLRKWFLRKLNMVSLHQYQEDIGILSKEIKSLRKEYFRLTGNVFIEKE